MKQDFIILYNLLVNKNITTINYKGSQLSDKIHSNKLTHLKNQINTESSPTPLKGFLDKFFDLYKHCQQELPPREIAAILRDYARRLDY